jgi:hypothetical protein
LNFLRHPPGIQGIGNGASATYNPRGLIGKFPLGEPRPATNTLFLNQFPSSRSQLVIDVGYDA